jgi:hypothetical protein
MPKRKNKNYKKQVLMNGSFNTKTGNNIIECLPACEFKIAESMASSAAGKKIWWTDERGGTAVTKYLV